MADRHGHARTGAASLAALLTALAAASATLAAAVALAVLYPVTPLAGTVGASADTVVEEGVRRMPQLLAASAGPGGGASRTAPVLFVVVPLAASSVAAFALGRSLSGLSPSWRATWALGAGVAFALFVLGVTVAGG